MEFFSSLSLTLSFLSKKKKSKINLLENFFCCDSTYILKGSSDLKHDKSSMGIRGLAEKTIVFVCSGRIEPKPRWRQV
jgi:hypothetical protein